MKAMRKHTECLILCIKPHPLCYIQAKAEADKRAKMMSDLDDEFGVADIVQDKLKKDQAKR